MARLWGSHCFWTHQGSLRQGTYRSRVDGASEANYAVEEVIKVRGVLIWPVQTVDHPVSSTQRDHYQSSRAPRTPVSSFNLDSMQKSALILLDMQMIVLSHIKIMSFFNYRNEKDKKACGLGVDRHFLNKNRGVDGCF